MRHRILAAALLVLARHFLAQAGCIIGSTNTITLAASSQSFNYASSGSKESLPMVNIGSFIENGTNTSGTKYVFNQTTATTCLGTYIVVSSGCTVNQPSSQFTISNCGDFQNSLNSLQNQHFINNYSLASRLLTLSKETVKNTRGGISGSSSFAINTGNCNNNNGYQVVLSNVSALNVNLSGFGNVTVGGNLITNSGPDIHAKRSLQILDPLSHRRIQFLSFGQSLLHQTLFLRSLPVKAGFLHIKDQIPGFSSCGLCFTAYQFKPNFGINFQIMEKSKNQFSPNQLIYNI